MTGFALGRVDAVSAILPYETYYYLPLGLFTLTLVLTVLFSLFSKGERGARPLLALGFGLFMLSFSLSFSWTTIVQNALGTRWLLLGSVPTNDANDFHNTALTLLGRGVFETIRGRPLSDAAWAGALALFNLDLFDAVTLFTGLTALAMIMACLTGVRPVGVAGAAVLAACLFDYIHEHLGSVSSETPGFVLGLGAFSLTLYAAKARSRVAFVSGFAALSAAMVYRMGALFILPGLWCWAFRALGRNGRRPWGTLAGALLLLVAVFAANSAVTRQITPTSGGGFVNVIDSWYATLIEGDIALGRRNPQTVLPVTRWVQMYEDFPDLKNLRGSEWVARKYDVFFSTLADRPLSALVGGALEINNYLVKRRVFAFIDFKPLRYLVMLLALIGVGVCAVYAGRRKDPVAGMLLWGNLGILISQPFLYGGEVRVPAPTIAFTLMLAAFGVRGVLSKVQGSNLLVSLPAGATSIVAAGTAACVMLLSAYGIAQRGEWRVTGQQAGTCPGEARKAAFSLPVGGGLVVGSPLSQFGHARSVNALTENLARQRSLLETNSRLRSTIFDDPCGPKTSWILKTVAKDPKVPFFAGTVLDRISGQPVQVIIPEPRPHRSVHTYCLIHRDDGTPVALRSTD